LFKTFVSWSRLDIARVILPFCSFDDATKGHMLDLLDQGKGDQVFDIVNLFEAYQSNIKELMGTD